MRFTHARRVFNARAHRSKAGRRKALARWLQMPRNHQPIIAGRLPGRDWAPIRLCYREPA